MSLNIEQITNRLAQMPDAALQKYAAMNKNDPYIVSLALSESNRRKQLRQAAQATQGQMPQPKVVDAAVQQMAAPAPEDRGIARLPAGDMNFADGGIVAFADGGEVERYQVGGVLAGTQYGIPGMVTPTEPFYTQEGAPEQTPLLQRLYADFVEGARNRAVEGARARIAAGYGSDKDLEVLKSAGQRASSPPPQTRKTFVSERSQALQNLSGMDRRLLTPPSPATSGDTSPFKAGRFTSAPAPAPAAAPAPAQRMDAGAPRASGEPTFAGLDPTKMLTSAESQLGKQDMPEKKMLEDLGKERVAAAEKERDAIKAINERYADRYKGRFERLDAREAELGGQKNQNLGLALLQAGAAMMSTPGGIGAALGKGVDVGSRQYVAGIDKLNAAKEKLADARDRLEELQLNRSEMSDREIAKAETGIRNASLSAREDMIKLVMDQRKVDRETALKIVDNQIRIGLVQLQEAGQNARSAASIAASQSTPERQYYNAMLRQAGGDPIKAQEAMAAAKARAQAAGFNVRDSYADYLKAFAGKDTTLGGGPMSLTAYYAALGVPLPR